MEVLLESEMFMRGFIVLVIVFLVVVLIMLDNLRKLSTKYKKFISKLEESDSLEENLENYLYKVKKVEEQFASMNGQIQEIKQDIRTCTKKIGIVRYNAFEDVGSNLSFAIALLDGNDNGIILNGVYARETSSVFSKEVVNGVCNNVMSKEETEALNQAKNK